MTDATPPTIIQGWLMPGLSHLGRRSERCTHEIAHLVLCPDEHVLDPHYGLGPTPEDLTTEIWVAGEARVHDVELVVAHWLTGRGLDKSSRRWANRERSEEWYDVYGREADDLIESTLSRFPDVHAIWREFDRKRKLVLARTSPEVPDD